LHELSETSQDKTATAAEAGACAVLPSEDGMFIYTALCAHGVCVSCRYGKELLQETVFTY